MARKIRNVVIVFLAIVGFVGIAITAVAPFAKADWQKEAGVVSEIFNLIENAYLYPVNLTECRDYLLKNLSAEDYRPLKEKGSGSPCLLDAYSGYLTADEARIMDEQKSSHFGGVGVAVEFNKEAGEITVIGVFENGPADKAGLKIGDVIFKARDENEKESSAVKDSYDAVKRIRGAVGTKIFITVKRNGSEIDLPAMVREDIKVATIEKKVFPGNIFYVRIKTFGPESADDLEDALRLAGRIKDRPRVILDLRDNPGGLLGSAEEMLFYFSANKNDIMVTLKEKRSENVVTVGNSEGNFVEPKTKKVKKPGEFKDYKIVILINGRSASASELFTGTMQDWGSMVIGEKSFGKGVGQGIFELADKSALRLTTFEFLVGNGKKSVNKIGIAPDLEVEWKPGAGEKDEEFAMRRQKAMGDPVSDPQLGKALWALEVMK
ncbi:PDZ domain-containing protein [Candidatus Uhrbacteria bacterium]|nr:PDZ domain-containing protein [Candidatus Uhrbacteria bacterium]